MIQFNLLPDVKIEFIKAKRTKRMVVVIATVISIVSVGILIMLFLLVNVVQKQHLNNLSADIERTSKKLKNTQDIGKILTIQNQLLALDNAHNAKPVVSRLQKYIEQVTPNSVGIADFEIDFTTNKIIITGNGKLIADVNQYADTLKFTKYAIADEEEEKTAFSKVVLTSFGRNEADTTYTIEFEFDPIIFDAKTELTLKVPNIITTRSELEKPDALFQKLITPAKKEEQR